MQPGLFRSKALSRLSSPEQLDKLMRVTSPRSWLAFFGLGAVIVAAIAWGFVGDVPNTVSGQAVLIHQGGTEDIVAMSTGQVVKVTVNPGDTVAQGQVIAWLRPLSAPTGQAGAAQTSQEIPVTSPSIGRIVEVLASPGIVVSAADPVATIEGLNEQLEAYTYIPIGPGKQIKPGMVVNIAPVSVSTAQYGYLIGHVQSVSDFPVTQRSLSQLVDNDQLTQDLLSGGPVLQVIVQLQPDGKTASGFKWSSPKGPPFELTHGTLASAQVIVSRQRPFNLVLPGT